MLLASPAAPACPDWAAPACPNHRAQRRDSRSPGRRAAMPLVYAQVARATDGTVLADHAAVAGNFRAVVAEVLARVQRGGDDRCAARAGGAWH